MTTPFSVPTMIRELLPIVPRFVPFAKTVAADPAGRERLVSVRSTELMPVPLAVELMTLKPSTAETVPTVSEEAV